MKKALRFLAVFIACTIGKIFLDFISLIVKSGIVAIWQVVNNIGTTNVNVNNFVALHQTDPAHALIEGLIIAVIVWLLMSCNMSTKRYSFAKKLAIVFIGAVAFEFVAFASSMVQFIANGIWAAVTTSAPSVTIRNSVAITRWANIDYILRLCEGLSMLKTMQVIQAQLRRKTRKERG